MLFRRNAEAYLPVRLLTATCTPALGITPTQLLGGGVCITLAVGGPLPFPGFHGVIPLVNGDTWREVDPVCAPGLYLIELDEEFFQEWIPWGGRADLMWSVMPAAAQFNPNGFIGEGTVEDLPQHIANYPLARAVVRTFGQAFRLWRQMLAGRVKVDAVTNVRSVFGEDASHALAQVNTLDQAPSPSVDPILETTEIAQAVPAVASATPPAGPIAPGAVFDVFFSKDIFRDSILEQHPAFRLFGPTGAPVSGTITRFSDTHYRFTPAGPLGAGAYSLVLSSGIVDMSGNPLTPFSRSYTV